MGDAPFVVEICQRPPLSGNARNRPGSFPTHLMRKRASVHRGKSLGPVPLQDSGKTPRDFRLSTLLRRSSLVQSRDRDLPVVHIGSRPAVCHPGKTTWGIGFPCSGLKPEVCLHRQHVSNRSLRSAIGNVPAVGCPHWVGPCRIQHQRGQRVAPRVINPNS